MAAPKPIFVTTLTFERSTKNTHVYVGPENGPIRTLYVQASAVADTPPASLTIAATEK